MFTDHKWSFPNGCVKNIGINNGYIETFKDTPINSLGREICQNSLDARKDDSVPVVVEFETLHIKSDSFPDIEELRYAINQGAAFWKAQKNPKADKFYAGAKKAINDDEMCILRISDHNTFGLNGADEPDNTKARWTSLVMSEGASSKDGTEGGSFGIGKFAAFANSKIRTVFYSTRDSDGKEASEGICYLASFIDRSGSKTFGEGYCGNGSMPVFNQISFASGNIRDEKDSGTDVYICAFGETSGWKEKLISSVLDGFMYAVDKRMLVVKINGETISSETLDDIVLKYSKSCSEYALDYYKVLRSDGEWIRVDNYKNTGALYIKLLVDQGLHRKVAMVRRTGMKIVDKGNISGQIPFAGILYVDGVEANKYLVSLENPAHTKWLPERDEENEEYAIRYIGGFTTLLKEELSKLVERDFGGEVTPELGNLLQSVKAETGGNNKQEVVSDTPEKVETTIKVTTEPSKPKEDEGEGQQGFDGEGGKDHGGTGKGGGAGGFGQGTGGSGFGTGKDGEGKGGNKLVKNKYVKLSKRRSIAKNAKEGEYLIKLSPAVDCENAVLELGISGEDNSYMPEIVSVAVHGHYGLTRKNNKIMGLSAKKGEEIKIELKVRSTDYVSFEVKCYEDKD